MREVELARADHGATLQTVKPQTTYRRWTVNHDVTQLRTAPTNLLPFCEETTWPL